MDFEKTYDVVIAGAGVAGIAAALECARAGLQTALVEKTVLLGGLATTGLINIYLPLCDGNGHQAIFGIAEELLHLSLKYGPGDVPDAWMQQDRRSPVQGPRYMTPFSPASFVLAIDEALQNSEVVLWLDTLVCAPMMGVGRRITGLEVENKSGRGVLRAAVVIDATGDADVAYRAGAPCVESDNWLSLWALESSLARARAAAADPEHTSLLERVTVGGDANGRNHPPDQPKVHGTNGEEVTRFVLEGRRLLRERYQARQAELGERGRTQLFPVTLPAMAQFRTTRRIDGLETMTTDHPNTHLPTSIALVPDWRRPGPVWEVPYGALVARGVQGLLAAGRCCSAEGEAWEVSRVIPPAALTGQVAGVAAALAVWQGTTPDAVDAADVQQVLRHKGIPFQASDIMGQEVTGDRG
ncbi:MAG: FAD-dependent oxidoreductase [Anaerolineae bacterium]|jgi:2-polyprenyl-6-methoxyphenol hydroxylase-like FAD-dependent oxidoreductase|nr:FAD-dependent oxidoreductase [Anaerolineae bacterium]